MSNLPHSDADAKAIQQLCSALFEELRGDLGFDHEWFGDRGWLLFCDNFLALQRRIGWKKAYDRARIKAARRLLDQCQVRHARGELHDDFADDRSYCRALMIVDGLA